MNTDSRIDQVVAEFVNHDDAEKALRQLARDGVRVENLSIIGREYHTEEQPTGYVNTGDRMLSWGKMGAFWGSIWGMLFGSALLVMPGVGSILLAGWFVTTLAGAIEGAAVGGGFAALSAAFYSIGIPRNSVISYQRAIEAGKFVVMVKGSPAEVGRAQTTLLALGGQNLIAGEQRMLEKTA